MPTTLPRNHSQPADAPPTSATPADETASASLPTPADSSQAEIDAALSDLVHHARDWARLGIPERRAVLRELRRDVLEAAPAWAEACRRAEGLPPTGAGEKWLSGPYMVARNLRLLDASLADIDRLGAPRPAGHPRRRADGRLAVPVFPASTSDRLFYPGVEAEVWIEGEVAPEDLADHQAGAYREPTAAAGGVALVLGAGNVSSIGPMDLLSKLFVENQVVALKMHPVNAFLGPIFAQAFGVLIDRGALRILYGGADVGDLLCRHEAVDEIHVTGSDATVEAIVFGPGEEGRRNKAAGTRRNPKPISSELGNVSPVIVVPGPWSPDDLDWQGENLASMLVNNAGFNCNAARVLVQHAGWEHRDTLLDAVRHHLAATPTRRAYYPGAAERHADFVAAHPDAETFGEAGNGELPWTLIADVSPQTDNEICFRREAFCGVIAETALDAPSVEQFLERAVDFCNQRLWGTLNATILVHPLSLADRRVAAAFESAVARLRYGTVAVNCWAAVGYGLVSTPWGAYPGHTLDDIQSGTGFVHNTLMLENVEKAVVRAPFRMTPKPPWFASHRTVTDLARSITEFESEPSPGRLPSVFWPALRA
ncbi:MAG: aldehyde dehydrogenase family protein [Acidobacteriota bacterium]